MVQPMSETEAQSLIARCNKGNEIDLFDRHIHLVDDFVVMWNNAEAPAGSEVAGELCARNINAVEAMRLVAARTNVPVAEVMYFSSEEGIIIQRRIPGVLLFDVIRDMSAEQLAIALFQVAQLVCQLAKEQITTCPLTAAGGHRIFQPTAEEHLAQLSPDELARQVFILSHLDLHPSNIIITEDWSQVAGLIDWERAAYVPLETASYAHEICGWSCCPPEWGLLFEYVKDMMGLRKL